MRAPLFGSRQHWLPGVFLALVVLLSGCATQTHTLLQSAPVDLPRRHELTATPFFPQEDYQCGPATLATLLNSAGIAATSEQLVDQVYLPARQGSLQAEMIAAGRRNGALTMTIPPRLDALLHEVASGTPVGVLQNLSLPVRPVWHYAVVIGYDLDRAELVLRSGTTERLTMPISTFEHTWKRSGHWAIVALPPERLPRTAEEGAAVPALVALERSLQPDQAYRAYRAALQRWPHNLLLLLGAGNSAYAAGQLDEAAEVLRTASRAHPGSAPAFNNLANVLFELGHIDEALTAARAALAIGGEWSAAARVTLARIESARAGGR